MKAQDHVVVRAPAKLNLYLELLRRREDGYHDLDTVMVPISLRDTLVVHRTQDLGIRMRNDWWPSREHWLDALGGDSSAAVLEVPTDQRNLIHRAVEATFALTNQPCGIAVQVRKRIPAGAGMGGASSDAAAAIRATSHLLGICPNDERLWEVAAQIGSDVPFFLGLQTARHKSAAIQARGRGEILHPVALHRRLRFLVAYPAVSLSTALVYRHATVPAIPQKSEPLLEAMKDGDLDAIGGSIFNRLTDPAIKISAMVGDLLQEMWRCGLPRCQLTGSGAACFSLLNDVDQEQTLMRRLNLALRRQALPAKVFYVQTVPVPQPVRTSNR